MILERHFRFDKQYLSELGVRYTPSEGTGSSLKTAIFPEIFNITLIITGMLVSPFFIGVYVTLKPEKKLQKAFFISTAVTGVFSGIALSLIGVFDLGYFYYPHMTVTGMFYAGAMFTSFLWGVGVFTLDKESPYKQSKFWIAEPIMSFVVIFIGIINSTLAQDFPQIFGFIRMALWQKLFVYSVFILISIIIFRFIRIVKKEKIEKMLLMLP